MVPIKRHLWPCVRKQQIVLVQQRFSALLFALRWKTTDRQTNYTEGEFVKNYYSYLRAPPITLIEKKEMILHDIRCMTMNQYSSSSQFMNHNDAQYLTNHKDTWYHIKNEQTIFARILLHYISSWPTTMWSSQCTACVKVNLLLSLRNSATNKVYRWQQKWEHLWVKMSELGPISIPVQCVMWLVHVQGLNGEQVC